MRELAAVFASCAEAAALNPGLRAVIVTGAGEKAFVAGADIAALATMTAEQAGEFSRLGHLVGERIESLPIPVIAAVNGFALGGGCELALACDFIYAAESARFGQPEVKLGAIPGFGGTQRLMRRVGIARARELLFTRRHHRRGRGAAHRPVQPDFPGRPADDRGAAHGGPARGCAPRWPSPPSRRALRAGADQPLPEALRQESELFASLFSTADLKSGMQAFLSKQKQPPPWQGR